MVAIATDTLLSSYRALTEGCGLIDRSDRGKLALCGAGAVEFLNGQVTNELQGLQPGDGCYAAFLTHKGKMLGDLRILAVGATGDAEVRELLLDTERVALQALFDMINRFKIGYDVQLEKRTLQCGLVSLIGPRAREALGRALRDGGDPDAPPAEAHQGWLARREHAHRAARIGAAPVRVIAAEADDVDLLFAAEHGDAVTGALVAAGATVVGGDAGEVIRVQRGRPRYGIDLDETTIPQEAGLNERAVSFTKGCYVGQETVARLYYKGKPNRHLRGLRLTGPAAGGEQLTLEGRPVGSLTSVVDSPALGQIGLALVRREAAPGTIVSVGDRDGREAEIVELPWSAPQAG